MATHSSVLAGRIPWTEVPGGLPDMTQWLNHHQWISSCLSWCWFLETKCWLRILHQDFPGGARDMGSILGLGGFHTRQSNWVCEPLLPSPSSATLEARAPRACALQQSGRDNEKPLPHNWRVAPALHSQRKPVSRNEDPAQPEINQMENKYKIK